MDTMAVFAGMLFVVLAAVIRSSVAYPTGAPKSVCQSMYPQHGNFTSKNSTAPFTISVDSSSKCYTLGKALTVELKSTDGTEMEGFLMEARKANVNTASYGVFATAGNSKLQTLSCFEGSNNAITHNTKIKDTRTNFTWTPPQSLTDNITLIATVVEETDEFWVQGVSLTLTQCPPSNDTSSAISLMSNRSWPVVTTMYPAVLLSLFMSAMRRVM